MFLSNNRHHCNEILVSPELFLRLSAGNPFEHKGKVPMGASDHLQSSKVGFRDIPKRGQENRKYSQNTLLPKSLLPNEQGIIVNKADKLQRIAVYSNHDRQPQQKGKCPPDFGNTWHLLCWSISALTKKSTHGLGI